MSARGYWSPWWAVMAFLPIRSTNVDAVSDLPEMRIADRDREFMSERLRVAYAEGRIDEVELEDRLAAVFEARTRQQLELVVVDLPKPPASAPVVPVRAKAQRQLGWLGPFLFPPIICTAIYLMTIPGQYFWPMWVWFGCGIPAVMAFFYGRGDDGDDD